MTIVNATPIDINVSPIEISQVGPYNSITNIVGARIVDLLTAYNKTSIENQPLASAFVATDVRQGLFQDNPVKRRIALMVNPNDPDDTQAEPKRGDSLEGGYPFKIDPFEVGGGGFYWIVFTIDVIVYLASTQEHRDEARQIGMWVMGRARQAIKENQALGLTDDFGDTALFMFVDKTNKWEGGGPPKSFNWNAKIFISVLVESSMP